jgi:hypothetical protein
MENSESMVSVKDVTANPAPLGLMGFGMTTVLLNLHNAGIFELGSMILAMGIFYGGVAQVIAGIMEWKKGNTFGTVAFTSYGLFWLSLVGILVFPKLGWGEPASNSAMVAYLFSWGVFTLVMYFGTLKLTKELQVVFSTLAVLFFLLGIADMTGSDIIMKIAGYEGIVCGASAVYTALSLVLKELYAK